MSTRNEIPAHARCVRSDSATIPTGPDAGVVVHWSQWDGMASDGYKSNFTARPCAWLSTWLERPGSGPRKAHTYRFGGRNVAKAEVEYRGMLARFTQVYPGASATFPTA